MTHLAVIENKISSIKKYLKILDHFKKYSKRSIREDIIIRGSLERYLYLTIQSAIDLGEAIIAYKHFRKPVTFSETFDILQEEKILAKKLAEKLVQMTGFRNIIAHDYEQINYDIVFQILHHDIEDIKTFLKSASKVH